MSTLKEVAEFAGVSTFTVSRVLSGRGRESRISESRIKDVTEAARKLGYRPNSAARATREKRTRQVGVLLYNHAGCPGFTPQNQLIVQGINCHLQKFGYLTTLVRFTDLDYSEEIKHRAFVEECVDGIIAVNMLPPALERQLDDHFKKCVWVDGNMTGDARCLRRDEELAGRLPVEHAAAVGYRRVLYIDHSGNTHDESLQGVRHYSAIGRRRGAEVAAAKLGLDFDAVAFGQRWGDFNPPNLGRQFVKDTLVLAYNVGAMRVAMRVAMEARKCVGRDFGFACCESTAEFEIDWPDLCHSVFDRYELGIEAAQMLLGQLEASRGSTKKVSEAVSPRQGNTKLQESVLVSGKTAPGPPAS